MTRVAVVQMSSAADVATNLAAATRLVGNAAAAGAKCILLPENFAFMGAHEHDKLAHAEVISEDATGPILTAMRALAVEKNVALILGGMPEQTETPDAKVYNACVYVNSAGEIVATYRKIHLFDVTTPDGVEYYESRSVEAGHELVVIDTPAGSVGLSICYDVRFAELYRALEVAGANVFVVPAAFTKPTGEAHWHVLLRARAIENLSYVLAAAQVGTHPGGRQTFGHALICDPWGKILAECETGGEEIAIADIDIQKLTETRARFPVLTHHRL